MKDIIITYLKRPFSLGRIKVLMFIPFITGILFDFNFNADLKNNLYDISSGGNNPIVLIVLIMLFFFCLILIDFRHANNNRKERILLLKSIRDPNISDETRKELMDHYNSKS